MHTRGRLKAGKAWHCFLVAIESLPADVDALQALVLTRTAERDAAIAELAHLKFYVDRLQNTQFGKSSEKRDANQVPLPLENMAQPVAAQAPDSGDERGQSTAAKQRKANRGNLPDHLPQVHETLYPDDTNCPCCRAAMHVIGEDQSKRLDVIPAQFRVLVTHRPKYACRACEGAIVQAPAPERLIKAGLPTEALVAFIIVSKYAWHLPLYRQAQMLALQGIKLDRSTLAFWVAYAAGELAPVYERLKAHLKASLKINVDETTAPVLDPGRGRTKTGYFWAIARDDRPWGGPEPPGVVFTYAPGRGAVHAYNVLKGYSGIVQCDGYPAYKTLVAPARAKLPKLDITLAFCWTHWRRYFTDIERSGPAPIAAEAIRRIGQLYGLEKIIRGKSAEERRVFRQERSRPIVEALKAWLQSELAKVSESSTIADALRYGLSHWQGLTRFLEDGRIELDTNAVERAIRPIALGRKNHLFSGHDCGAQNWASIASLIETAKLQEINPQDYLTDVLTKLVNGWPMSDIDSLLPWAWVATGAEARMAA